jgi:hypothetical protein
VHLVTALTVVQGQPPIQNNGVLPDIDVGNKAWPAKLTALTGNVTITQAVKSLIDQ